MRAKFASIVACTLAGCTTTGAPSHPRPALPLPADVIERYELGGEVIEEFLVPLADDPRVFRGRLTCGEEHPEFHLVLPERTPAPFLLCLPILAGGSDLMQFIAHDMADRGYVVAWGKRVQSALKPHQSPRDVETLFRRSIVHNRAVLAWARRQTWVTPGADALLGISTGGILAGTMLAVEPELSAGILILAGGDLPDLLQNSSESRIVKWREHRRQEDAKTDAEWTERLRRELHSDPARCAAYVPTGKVFMVVAGLDTVVPSRNRELLWEGFGRPARMQLPLFSHYSAVLGILPVLSAADGFITRKLWSNPDREPSRSP